MNKAEFINQIAGEQHFWQRTALLSSFISCLTAEEACDALRPTEAAASSIRQYLLRHIVRKLESDGAKLCHSFLIDRLISEFPVLPPNSRSGCGYCLTYLYPVLPSVLQSKIMDFMLGNRYSSIRRRAFKLLRENWRDDVLAAIADNWRAHPDHFCAVLMIERFPSSSLLHEIESIEQFEGPGYWLSRLYLRLVPEYPECIGRLRKIDPISMAYVMTKMDEKLSEQEAREIFAEVLLDERVGLFLWCLGQMGLWKVVQWIYSQKEELLAEQYDLRHRATKC